LLRDFQQVFYEFGSKKRSDRVRLLPFKDASDRKKEETKMRKSLLVLSLAALSTPVFAADANLKPGDYDVTVRLELPHVEDMGYSKDAHICVSDGQTQGIVVLSDNNPLARCPASNIKRDGDTLTFDLVCEGHNQAIASAKFTLNGDRFDGAFDMKMGGKNMTMTERQSGHLTGTCAQAEISK
jgi:hypothetical protein